MKQDLRSKIQDAVLAYLKNNKHDQINLKATLFDMDGVLYDSMPNHAVAWKQTADTFGLDSEPRDFYLYEGQTAWSTIEILYQRTFGRSIDQEDLVDQMYQYKSNIFNSLKPEKVMPGAYELLRNIRKDGYRLVLVSGSSQKNLYDKLNRDFPNCFERPFMITGKDVKYGKPNPEPYLLGLKAANVKANEAIVVENAPMGVRSAVNAGIFTIAVNTGILEDEDLLKENASILFNSMSELKDNWQTILEVMQSNKKTE